MTVSPRFRPSPVTTRTEAGPVSGRFEVVAAAREGAYRTLTVQAPDIARRAAPGQFIEVAVEGAGTLLRRPFSIGEVAVSGPGGGTVTFVFDAHGPGTTWLAGVGEHDQLDIVGPLGVPFPLPNQSVSAMLVGGGYGAAPLYWLADQLRRGGHRVDMVVGASTQERLHRAIEAKRMSSSVVFTTDDGSTGHHGRVTDVLPARLEACRTQLVYACGPMPMLRAVAEVCDEEGVACQVAVEEHMACGIGVCWTCVVPVRDPDGAVRHRRACIDGPVFDGSAIDWDATRWTVGPSTSPDDDPDPPPSRPSSRELFG